MVRRDYQLNGQDSIMYDGELSQVQAIQNAAHARVYGIQLGMEFKWKSGISASTRFNYQKGREELDDGSYSPLRHAAPWFGINSLELRKEKNENRLQPSIQRRSLILTNAEQRN